MDNLKKLGLSALAGSLVAFSANAGELSVSGGAKISYTGSSGNEDDGNNGNRFGMQRLVTMSGSGELDNGMSVSLVHTFATSNGDGSTSAITLDMGSMGTLGYGQDSYQVGISKIDDIIPTAEEEVSNGLSLNATESATGAVNGNTYEVDLGGNGFNYTLSAGDMATVVVGWAPRGVDNLNDDGGMGGTDGDGSDSSVHVVLTPMDGLTVVAGSGEKVNGNQMDDLETFGATYTYGPVSAGIQVSEIDYAAANSGTARDADTTYMGIAFNVNENLSISYGEQETDLAGVSVDQELEGFSVGYSMGGISLKAHSNQGTGMGGVTSNESEHTEISVSFAF
jgi:outer membrane protein OmpU